MKIIVKADDYGSTIKVTEGIIEAINKGVVTDTSFLVNTPYFNYSIKRAQEVGLKKMGLHLTATYRKPLLNPKLIPSLVDSTGSFYKQLQDPNLNELEKEFRAQIKKFQLSGLKLTHFDTHHHIHRFDDSNIGALIIKLAKEFKVPIRKPLKDNLDLMHEHGVISTDFFTDRFGGSKDRSTVSLLLKILKQYVDLKGSLEIMCHPGYVDDELRTLSSWNECREVELDTLTDKKIIDFIDDNNIELISFADLMSIKELD